MDNQIVHDIFTCTIKAAEALGTDADFVKVLKAKRAQLPPMQVGKFGQLQEWLEDLTVRKTSTVTLFRICTDYTRRISCLPTAHRSFSVLPALRSNIAEMFPPAGRWAGKSIAGAPARR